MATDYATVAELKARVGVEDAEDDASLAAKITAASRWIDGYCGRSFWQDSAVVTRDVFPSSADTLDLLDQPGEAPAREISTTTGLIVALDTAGNGTYSTTPTISTDFLLYPRGADTDGRGFSEVRLIDGNYSYSRSSYGRPTVRITAKFGWPSIPADVKEACLVRAAQLKRMEDAAFGIVSFGDGAAMRAGRIGLLTELLAPYQIVPVG